MTNGRTALLVVGLVPAALLLPDLRRIVGRSDVFECRSITFLAIIERPG